MSEEEKKAIKLLKEIADVRSCTIGDDLYEEDAKILLNLIEKQQKEIEELQKKNNRLLESIARNGGYKIGGYKINE